ncbi:MAG: flagellar assembly protein FliW [Phycisphaerales bacterium]|nr:flagellar assembly protein FliW [Phycisphaerales bacterium]
MDVQTSRFGTVTVDDDRIITFSSGLLGFSTYHRYALLVDDAKDSVFFWLQSLDAPELAFVVTDPSMWVPGYEVPVRQEQFDEIGLAQPTEGQVLVIVNKHGDELTANLQGPLLINSGNRQGMQLVLADKRWTTRHGLFTIGQALHAASA